MFDYYKSIFYRLPKHLENPTWFSKRWPFAYWRIYHFSWKDYYFLFENRLAKLALPSSAVGYFIYLNDWVTKNSGFDFITNNSDSFLGISLREKLYFLYFGLLLIALGRLWYVYRCPHALRNGPSATEWTKFGLNNFVYSDFLHFHGEIREEGHRTLYGKYYDDNWDAFYEDAVWREAGKTERRDKDNRQITRKSVDYSAAKLRHEDLLRSILLDRYAQNAATRKISLLVGLLIILPGYILFLVPNIDLTLTVMSTLL